LTDFVAAVVPAALPTMPAGCSSRRRRLHRSLAGSRRSPRTRAAAASLKPGIVRAVSRMEGGALALDAVTSDALQKLLDDPADDCVGAADRGKWDNGAH
jgi:hypothetical protein